MEETSKKVWYKKWWVWIIGIIVGLSLWFVSIPVGIAWLWFKSNFKYKKTASIAASIIFVLLVVSAIIPDVEYRIVTQTESIPYKTIEKKAPDIVEGGSETTQTGVNGEKKITYENKFVNGEFKSQRKIKEVVINKPVNEIKLVGTLPKKVKIKEARGYYLTALSLIKNNKFSEALKYLRKAIDTYPGTYKAAEDKERQVTAKVAALKAERVRLAALQKKEQEIANFKKACKTIPYKVLERDADSLIGKKVFYKGQVFTIQASKNYSVVQLYVTYKGYDIWDDQAYMEYPGKMNVFKEDIIKIWGVVDGLYTYESVAGYNITVPKIIVKYYSK